MSDYLFLAKIDENINSSIHITNFIPNRRAKTDKFIDFKLGVYTQTKTSITWKKLDEVFFNNSYSIVINSQDYLLDVGQIAVVIPVAITVKLQDNLSVLPKPISRKKDKSPVNERASIVFSTDNSNSSYQGDFPYPMSCIPKGSLLSFSPLIKAQDSGVKVKVIIVNIYSQALKEKNIFHFCVADANNKKQIKCSDYTHNSVAIIDLIDNIKEYVFYSKNSLGIPIFISYNNDGTMISVEHTHPPSECFWGENRRIGQGILKSNWLKQLP